jgi:hypothetical protein
MRPRAARWWGIVALVLGGLAAAPAPHADTLFLVAENPADGPCFHCDSYVLPLSNPAHIEQAREIIEAGGDLDATIAVAAIAAGADGVNRDLLAPGDPAWSWHVTGFDGFADNTIEVLDGWPGFVEEDVEGWIANTNGYVGFWGYTVVMELPEADRGLAYAVAALALGAVGRMRGNGRSPTGLR